jgi:hypothetical protein
MRKQGASDELAIKWLQSGLLNLALPESTYLHTVKARLPVQGEPPSLTSRQSTSRLLLAKLQLRTAPNNPERLQAIDQTISALRQTSTAFPMQVLLQLFILGAKHKESASNLQKRK